MMVVSPAINGTIISKFGTDEQKKRWMPGIADGSITMAFAITEPDAAPTATASPPPPAATAATGSCPARRSIISGIDQAQAVLVVGRT